jgi:phosphinothricin acetyltransferase
MLIEDASEEDILQIVAIYNDVIATSTAVFAERPATVEERLDWLRSRVRDSYPVVVAREDPGTVVGFASYGDFRPWPGYRSTVEHSLHVAAGHRRRGVGRRLLEELLARAGRDGKHAMVAGIDAENHASLRLHEQLGFREVGRMPEIARKFDRWVELVLLQRTL